MMWVFVWITLLAVNIELDLQSATYFAGLVTGNAFTMLLWALGRWLDA